MKNIFLLFAALFACVSAWAQTTVTGVVTSCLLYTSDAADD